MPLNRRLPKRGFTNPFRKEIAVLNLDVLERLAGDSTAVDMERWVLEGIVKKARDGVKVLGRGEISRPLEVRAHFFSNSAKQKILAAGGRTEEIA
jgi:large subunit ribosomal protein L15